MCAHLFWDYRLKKFFQIYSVQSRLKWPICDKGLFLKCRNILWSVLEGQGFVLLLKHPPIKTADCVSDVWDSLQCDTSAGLHSRQLLPLITHFNICDCLMKFFFHSSFQHLCNFTNIWRVNLYAHTEGGIQETSCAHLCNNIWNSLADEKHSVHKKENKIAKTWKGSNFQSQLLWNYVKPQNGISRRLFHISMPR